MMSSTAKTEARLGKRKRDASPKDLCRQRSRMSPNATASRMRCIKERPAWAYGCANLIARSRKLRFGLWTQLWHAALQAATHLEPQLNTGRGQQAAAGSAGFCPYIWVSLKQVHPRNQSNERGTRKEGLSRVWREGLAANLVEEFSPHVES